MNLSIEKVNKHDEVLNKKISNGRYRLYIDILIKIIGFIVSITVFPPAMMIAVLVTMIFMIIPSKKEIKN